MVSPPPLTRNAWEEWIFSEDRQRVVKWIFDEIPRLWYGKLSFPTGDPLESHPLPWGGWRGVGMLADLWRWKGPLEGVVVESLADYSEIHNLRTAIAAARRMDPERKNLAEFDAMLIPLGRADEFTVRVLVHRAEAYDHTKTAAVAVYPSPNLVPHHVLALPVLAPSWGVEFLHSDDPQGTATVDVRIYR